MKALARATALSLMLAAGFTSSAAAAPDAVQRVADRSVVAISSGERTGAGVAWSPSQIVTSSRTVGDASTVRVVTASGRVLSADVDRRGDGVAILKVEKSGLVGVAKTSSVPGSGYVVGSPVGFSAGITSVSLTARKGRLTLRGALPGDATGAPVLDDRGRLAGVVTTRLPAGGRGADTKTIRAVERSGGSDGGGFPWLLAAAALFVIAVVGVIVAMLLRRRGERRRRELAREQGRARAAAATPPPPPPTAAAAPAAPSARSEAPTVVGPRSPAPPAEALPAEGPPAEAPPEPGPPDDDFEIVFRSGDRS